jgi:hypothetical protein
MTPKVLQSNLTSSTLHLSSWDFGIGKGAGILIDILSYIFWDLPMVY